MADIAAIRKLIEPEINALGYDLVRVAFVGGRSDPTLQVMAERPDTRQLDAWRLRADFEAAVGNARRAGAEGRDPVEGSYRLEVSSPGIDRPLTRLKDYDDWAGHEARITLAEGRSTGESNSRDDPGHPARAKSFT
jgi:ribosome maturation factor RimP